jgi:hypothetical protein
MKKIIKEYKLDIPIYDCKLDVLIGGSEKDFINKVKKWTKITEDGRLGCYNTIKKKNSDKVIKRILWIGRKDKCLILHETFHAVAEIMAYKGIRLVEDTKGNYVNPPEEAWAYLLEYIFKKIIKL